MFVKLRDESVLKFLGKLISANKWEICAWSPTDILQSFLKKKIGIFKAFDLEKVKLFALVESFLLYYFIILQNLYKQV